MEGLFLENQEEVHLFIFIFYNSEGKPCIDIYVWDCMLYPCIYKRFVICDGYRLNENDEKEYLHYIDEAAKGKVIIDDNYMVKLYESVCHHFPSWNYVNYPASRLAEAMTHLYFASHRSGVREILFKSGLTNIAYNICYIPGYNMIGTSPTSILDFGMPLKLLRILDHPFLICNLFTEDAMDACRKIYRKFSGYIGKETVSLAQWRYLEMLCFNRGGFAGKEFNRTLYNRLASSWDDVIVCEYSHFFELSDELPDLKIELPKISDIEEVTEGLELVYEFKTNKTHENKLIGERSKDSYYEYESDEYLVRMPRNEIDFCMEAIHQNNCVTNYIELHAAARTTILFVRERRHPEDSFVTMEVADNEIKQVYARFNALPGAEVYRFLESYSRVKGIRYDPRILIIENDADSDEDIAEELLLYVSDFEERNREISNPGKEIEYHQMTIQDFIPDLLRRNVGA